MVIDGATLRSWRTTILEEIDAIRSRLRPLEDQLKAKQDQLQALDQLLAVITADQAQEDKSEPASVPQDAGSFLAAAAAILAELGGPLHYKALFVEVRNRGAHVPGRNPEANLLAHMTRDDRFVWVGRGTYGLKGRDTARYGLRRRTQRLTR
jgi:hypothetical protein